MNFHSFHTDHHKRVQIHNVDTHPQQIYLLKIDFLLDRIAGLKF